MITNLAFENRFHYFCLIKKTIDKNEIHLTIELTKTHEFFSKPYGARDAVPAGVYSYYGSFYPAPKFTTSTNGEPGLLHQKILQNSDIDQESLLKIDEGALTHNLLEIIKKTIHDEHIRLIDDICSFDTNAKTVSVDTSHIFMHLYVWNADSYNITIAIDDFHSPKSDSNAKHFAGSFFVNNGELWGRPSYAVHENAMYVAKQLAINCKSEELKLIKNKLNGNLSRISNIFVFIYENHLKYREYPELSNRLADFIREIFPDQITINECSKFISDLRSGISHFSKFIDSFRLWFLDIAREALETLKTCSDIPQAVDSLALLSNSDVFFDLNEAYLDHLSALLVKAGANNQVNYLLPYFLTSFSFLPGQLNAVEVLVNNNFYALKQLSPSDSTNIALIYFHQVTAKYLASTFNSNIFESDSDYLDISNRLAAGTKNNELAVLEKLKKIFKRGEFNKILFTLKDNHAHMQEPATAGELLRIYIKCHLSVNANLNLDGIWIFGQILNDVGLLEIFATKLIEKKISALLVKQ